MFSHVDGFGVLFSKMHGFLKKGLFTDVTFVFQVGAKISAHKSVLAASSTVFEAMFLSSLTQGRTVEVQDVNQEVFTAFLDYVYLRDANVVKKHVNQLLMLADKYDVEPLALLCDGFVEASLTSENAVDSLLLADLYRRKDLKTKIGRFIKTNLEKISTHPSWSKLGDHFDVLNGLVHSFIQSDDAKVSMKLSNSVTWTLRNVKEWYKKKEIAPWESLTLIDVNPQIDFKVTLTYFECRIAVHIKAENQLNEDLSTEFSISTRFLSGNHAQTKMCLSWPPKSSEVQIFIPSDHSKEMYESLEYPLFVTVVVQQSASDRYQSIFSSLLKDNQKQYKIDGMDSKTFSRLLDYMYTLSNPNPGLVDLNLLRGAKEFQLDRLVDFCVSTLCNNVRHDNAVEICTTGEELGLKQLVDEAMDYMGKNPFKILNSTKWSDMKRHPRLTKELLFKLKS
ncbi:hypothetical protein GE061_014623 [Apolygus lucorum]|uniref:BTB domain-containing protein n=1 Tax=Apolygus lucorum TaxID=248454 RepID=A0A8S9XKS6_APOLU|nr:hypothetical protein GE061_014623 [Apolygus lucorum]